MGCAGWRGRHRQSTWEARGLGCWAAPGSQQPPPMGASSSPRVPGSPRGRLGHHSGLGMVTQLAGPVGSCVCAQGGHGGRLTDFKLLPREAGLPVDLRGTRSAQPKDAPMGCGSLRVRKVRPRTAGGSRSNAVFGLLQIPQGRPTRTGPGSSWSSPSWRWSPRAEAQRAAGRPPPIVAGHSFSSARRWYT